MGKFIDFPGGMKGAVGIAVVVLVTMALFNRFAPAKVRSIVAGG